MATITLSYNAHNSLINSILNSAILAGATIVEDRKKTKKLTPFEQSLEDIKCGRVTKVKNIDNIIEEILQ